MKKITLIFLVFTNSFCHSQLDKEVNMNLYKSLWRINDDVCFDLKSKRKKIYWNGRAIDSTGLVLTNRIICGNRLVGYVQNKNNEKSFYSIGKDGVKHLGGLNGYEFFTTRNNFFASKVSSYKEGERVFNYNERNFSRLSLEPIMLTKFYNLDKISLLDSTSALELCNLYEITDNKLIATICDCSAECLFYQYYIVDLVTGNIKKIELNQREPQNAEIYRARIISNDDSHIEIKFFGAENKENNGVFIYDLDFKEISGALEHEVSTIGANYRDNKYLSDNIRSKLDDGREVIITYSFFMPLERSQFKIYNDSLLNQEDLNKCDRYQLGILKNMVFARHNYKFSSNYYQAYFNYFKFYNSDDMIENRIGNVDKILTSVDRNNLSLIKATSDKFKK